MKNNLILLALVSCLWLVQACKKDGASGGSSATLVSKTTDTASADNKLTPGQHTEEKDHMLGWLKSRKDLSGYSGILNSASSVFPMLYDDKRLRVSLFIPNDEAMGKLSADQRGKLQDGVPDDAELAILNKSIVRTTDFTWSGASNLAGQTVSFSSDGKSVSLNGKSAPILETVILSSRTRAYIIGGILE